MKKINIINITTNRAITAELSDVDVDGDADINDCSPVTGAAVGEGDSDPDAVVG
eukprot:CAMPEP_0201569724 /NCGR_PEP_ID=MMETSP0190_2-20130828/11569_1 /ASSEMBLY_ACC=CAM_ASM_000263 /TAXON_ID=37353 /ORGANISM="Rosalina sp." /LENGTH=53 /DNA_ID=CAMNT_0047992381 /DNA_START=163 /DNA_END=320 /DNA_ORIENTATION=-